MLNVSISGDENIRLFAGRVCTPGALILTPSKSYIAWAPANCESRTRSLSCK
jgi:hypothetical protein